MERIIDYALRREAREREEQKNKTREAEKKRWERASVAVDGSKVIEGD